MFEDQSLWNYVKVVSRLQRSTLSPPPLSCPPNDKVSFAVFPSLSSPYHHNHNSHHHYHHQCYPNGKEAPSSILSFPWQGHFAITIIDPQPFPQYRPHCHPHQYFFRQRLLPDLPRLVTTTPMQAWNHHRWSNWKSLAGNYMVININIIVIISIFIIKKFFQGW